MSQEILPSLEQYGKECDRRAINQFTKQLVTTGYMRITSPPGLVGRRFVVTHRTADSHIGKYDMFRRPEEVFSGGEENGEMSPALMQSTYSKLFM